MVKKGNFNKALSGYFFQIYRYWYTDLLFKVKFNIVSEHLKDDSDELVCTVPKSIIMRPPFGSLGVIIVLFEMAVGSTCNDVRQMSQVHGSNRVGSRSLLKERIDRALMHTGLEEVLEFGEDLIQIRGQLYFQTGTLLSSLLPEPTEFFEFDVIQILRG